MHPVSSKSIHCVPAFSKLTSIHEQIIPSYIVPAAFIYSQGNTLYQLPITLANACSTHILQTIVIQGLKEVNIHKKNNSISTIFNVCPDLKVLEISECNMPIIPKGAFVKVLSGVHLKLNRNGTKHIKVGAFKPWNKALLDLSNNPLTRDSQEIVTTDMDKWTFNELGINMRAELCKYRQGRHPVMESFDEIIKKMPLWVGGWSLYFYGSFPSFKIFIMSCTLFPFIGWLSVAFLNNILAANTFSWQQSYVKPIINFDKDSLKNE